MATDLERLVVSLEARTAAFEKAMNRAAGITNTSMRNIERRQATMVQRLNAGWGGVQRGIATAFAGAAAIRGAQQLIDASTRIENSLKVVGLAGEELDNVYRALFASAQRNMAPIETLTTLYSRLGLAQKELGATNDELLDFTDKVALALRVQGTTSDEARGALIQLSQAMGSGIVRAEEFNSVVEGAPSILRATAAGLTEAGGSVAKLRTLVIEGKLSSEAFFRAFLAGSTILEGQVANAEMTVSQGFVRLQNVLIDTAGKFDSAAGASSRTGEALNAVSRYIEQVGRVIEANGADIQRFMDAAFGTGPDKTVADEILAWARAMGEVFKTNLIAGSAQEMETLTQVFDRFGPAVSDADLALAEAEQSLSSFASNTAGTLGEIDAAAQDLFQQILDGKGSADLAAEAIAALGDARPDFAPLLSQIGGVIQRIYELRAAAVAASRPDVSGLPMSYAGQDGAGPQIAAPAAVSLADYPITGGSAGGGGGGGRSGADRFADAVAAQERRIAALQRETELQRGLNPLVDDYGYAVERLRAQIELENAATEAGLALTPQRQAQIDELASGYAMATAEAARLAEAQDMARQSAEDLANAGRQALDTIIDGFIEGRDAGEIFNDVLKDLGRNLLNIGLNMIGGGMQGGFNPLSLLGGLLGFSSGTANTGGMRGQVRGVVHGQEAVIPLPNGGRVPVDIRMPKAPAVGGGEIKVSGEFQVVEGNLVPVVTRISGQVAGQQVRAYDRQLPSRMQDIQMRQG